MGMPAKAQTRLGRIKIKNKRLLTRQNIGGFADICGMEYNRDLMYVTRTAGAGTVQDEQEIASLHLILSKVETLTHLSACCEIIDLTLFSVIKTRHLVRDVLRQHELKPFQFICNRN
jgi:hypothetical protein